ncbi:major facilitator superfamily domain-containing protein [Alternaria rosae]|uniref:major facilitator superfamily domain-containing protein n=1 Tax=Alternaria rosae TaxID=1187941 RepID=UPI001E8D46AB|nr:major facilitator superfamily domain-containing protein [Alternaria rosae]KAH6868520.1 major facilitator superfamily domain-containing protein [Alternaria rosae]
MGANDAAYGAIIPYLEEYYDLTYAVVSLIFLSPMSGYISAALLNNWLHVRFGQRGIAFLGPACHLVAYLGIALHPPYPVLVVLFIFSGFGNGIEDAAWNAWAGSLANANEVLGFLHGLYGLGALLSPLAATSLIAKRGWQWYQFYHIMLGGACIELATSLWAFRSSSAQVYCQKSLHANAEGEGRLKQALSSRVTWIAAIFLFGYVGAGGALGGWIVTFMRRERAGGEFESGIVATGFWTGIATGRFFLGPLFPAVIVIATKALPPHLHVSAIGFAAAIGVGGGAALPFAIGLLAQAKGLGVLQPIILAVPAALLVLWLCFPKLEKRKTGGTVSLPTLEERSKQWLNVDIDLVEIMRRAIARA